MPLSSVLIRPREGRSGPGPSALAPAAVLPAALAVLLATGCSTGGAPPANVVTVTASDTGCALSPDQAPSGPVTFEVGNTGSRVTEFYLYGPDQQIVGEVEDIGPGSSRRLTVQVPHGGVYQGSCKPGMTGAGIRSAFTVTGDTGPASQAGSSAEVRAYREFVAGQASELVTHTGDFVAAVKAGDVARAKARYPGARSYWERIEPVTEKLGELDAAVDSREDTVPPGRPWTGFHRLEKDLWVDGLKPDSPQVADTLLADVREVPAKAAAAELTPLDLANGAKELLDEVATTKLTGEEDRYSHTDLSDFHANVEGARAVVEVLRPALQQRDAQLLSTVDGRFAAAQEALERYRKGEEFVSYTELTPDQVKALAAVVDALSEPLSRVAGVVAQP